MPANLLRQGQGLDKFEMLTMSMDPQWCGLLFSLYSRQERWQLIGNSGLYPADPFGYPLIGAQACSNLETDWIALASSIGFEICSLSSTWALILETVKTTGLILLVGFGGLVCYKLYQQTQYGSRSRPPSPSTRHISSLSSLFSIGHTNNHQLVEELTDDNLSDIQEVYFGPQQKKYYHYYKNNTSVDSLLDLESLSLSEDATSEEETQNNKLRKNTLQSRFNRNKLLSRRNYRHRKINRNEKNDRHRFPTDTSNWLVNKISQLFNSSNDNYLLKTNGSKIPYLVNLNTSNEKPSQNWADDLKAMGIISLDLDNNDELGNSTQFKRSPNMTRDESYDSLGFSKSLPHKGSFDSTCSDLSYDIPEMNMSTTTIGNLDKIQQEINLLKSNCLLMDEDFGTIKSNRNFPGMSSLIDLGVSNDPTINQENISIEDRQKRARECFSGLYRLTTIPSGNTSTDNSESSCAAQEDDSIDSLIWDSPNISLNIDPLSQDISSQNNRKSIKKENFEKESYLHSNISNDGLHSLEWDADGMIEFEASTNICEEDYTKFSKKINSNTVMEDSITSVSTGLSLMSPNTEISSTSGVFSKSDNVSCSLNEFGCWSSEESGILDDEFNNIAHNNKIVHKYSLMLQDRFLISEKYKIIDLSQILFEGDKMIKALHIIESQYKISNVRLIRNDKFQPLSALLIQWILTGEGKHCVHNYRKNILPLFWNQNQWLKNWNLPEILDPLKNGVSFKSFDNCLSTLESMMQDIYEQNNREEYIINVLNKSELDFIMVLEALKLLLILKGIELYNEMIKGRNIPIYVAILYSKPQTADPERLSYLIGNCEQIHWMNEEILSLLADTLGISLNLINPFKYGSEKFIQCLPKSMNVYKTQLNFICENDYIFHIPFHD